MVLKIIILKRLVILIIFPNGNLNDCLTKSLNLLIIINHKFKAKDPEIVAVSYV